MKEELAARRLDECAAQFAKVELLMKHIQTFIGVSPRACTAARAAPRALYAPNGRDSTEQSIVCSRHTELPT